MTNTDLTTSAHTISGLVKVRAQFAGLIQKGEKELERLSIDLQKIDDALKVIDPNIDLDTIKPKRMRAPRNRQVGVTLHILDTLRTAETPLTARDLGTKLVEARGQAMDGQTVEKTVKQISTTLQHLRRQGTVEATKIGVGPQVWQLVETG